VSVERLGRAIEVDVARTANPPYAEYARLPFELVGDGVWYVDLSRISLDDFPALVDRLLAARGVVVDLRHYPQPNNELFRLLMTRDDHTPWLHVPHFTRPDHVRVRWEDVDSTPSPDPVRHLRAPVAFLIGPRQFSFGESLAGFVADLHLGALVGSPTGGINGNIAGVAEPSGCQTTFTGMRVTRRDGAQLYQRGIAPTASVTPTIEGLRAHRDEVLDAGIAIVRGEAGGAGARP
jgi:hypothetical protein